ncbi:MAG: ArsR family transcriptional regulator [Phycisphaerales bacterium]|nr:ArsR family transcriptional regulator [Phycisphaerales bacterium]
MANHGDNPITEAEDRFVTAWGQMGSAWGISRTMAEVHALLYITGDALCTDDIMARLEISRGNASMSLRALVDWGIVFRTHKRGDRKEYFVAEQDIWTMARAIVRERLKREVEPLLASLHEIRDLSSKSGAETEAIEAHNERIENLVAIFELIELLVQRFVSPSGEGLEAAAMLLNQSHTRDERDEREGRG